MTHNILLGLALAFFLLGTVHRSSRIEFVRFGLDVDFVAVGLVMLTLAFLAGFHMHVYVHLPSDQTSNTAAHNTVFHPAVLRR